jgi:hypothetical protein
VNREDFADWKRHPITQIVLSELAARAQSLTESLLEPYGDHQHDDVHRGAIGAYRDLLNMTADELPKEEN